MKKVRYGIIGMGNQGSYYASLFLGGEVENGALTAVCDTNAAKLERAKSVCGDIAYFDDYIKMLESGKNVILEIEVQGAMQVRAHYPEGVFIFVLPPSIEVLEERLRGRNTETDDVIKERLQRAKAEFKFIEKYNYVLINDTVENAAKTLGDIINAEKCSMTRNYKELKSEYID